MIKKNTVIIIILLISIAGIILPQTLNDLDEVWNYNFARCVADGLYPYKDFNMVQTPLLPIICGMVLRLTSNELIVMRILAVILVTTILFVIYKILEILKIHKYIINIFMIGIYLLSYKYFCIDYNFSVLLIILLTIYFELKNFEKCKQIIKLNFKQDLLLGILVGTSILFKQTTGLFLSIIFIFYKLLLVDNKEKFKEAFKIIIIRLLGVIIPIFIFVIYLIVSNTLIDFLDYTVYSLKTFSNKISYTNLLKGKYGIILSIFSILVPITIMVTYIITICRKIKTENQNLLFIFFAYSVASLIVIYPISDGIHFIIGSIPSIIAMFFMIWLLLNKAIQNKKIRFVIKCFLEAFTIMIILIIAIYEGIISFNYLKTCNKYNQLKHFKYIPASYESTKKIDDFILEENRKGKNVYILDATAALYMIPIDKYNKNYDMFLKGNLGADGEEGQIENLKKENDNTVVLIMNNSYSRNWQTPEKVRKYIIDNWTKRGEIEKFDIYEKEK